MKEWEIKAWNALTQALKARDPLATGRAADTLRTQGWRYRDLQQHATSSLGLSSFEFEERMAEADAAQAGG